MFKQAFVELEEFFKGMSEEYWNLRREYGIETVLWKEFNSLPAGFVEKRKAVMDKYTPVLFEKRDYFWSLDLAKHEFEAKEAMEVFSSIDTNDGFKVFLDLFAYMPPITYRSIFQALLSDQYIDHFRELISRTPVVPDTTLDMDEGLLSASGNHEFFGKLLIILFQTPTKNEQGVTSLQGVRNERARKELAVEILNNEVFR